MSLRLRVMLLILPLSVLMTGCFQQAGPALQQSGGVTSQPLTAVPNENPQPTLPVSTDSSVTTNTDSLPTNDTTTRSSTESVPAPTLENLVSPASATPGGIAITIISPTRPLLASPTPQSEQSTAGQADGGEATPTVGQFLTPAQPLSPNPTSTPAPQTPSGPATATPSGLITPTAFSSIESGGQCTHTVQPGENLYRIALKYEVSLETLRAANSQLSGDLIQPGDVLNIPDCEATPAAGGGTSTTAVPTTVSTPLPGGSQTYVVQNGDTLYSIAIKFGVTIADIQTANNMDNPNRLAVGQELIIPAPPG